MKLVFIRHGDPNYSIDSLTEKGWREAALLAERVAKMDVKEFYVSPLGRAKDTASLTLKKMNRTATEYEWLREFKARITKPDENEPFSVWDWVPELWTKEEKYFDKDNWTKTDVMMAGNVEKEYNWVITKFDKLLEEHGYSRENNYYRVTKGNMDTLVFFCHFGVECVLLSHLIGVSPMTLWHGFCAAPTSVTTVITEERRKGIASFRAATFGDISHLYVADEPPAFAARFCECFENADERHETSNNVK